MRRLPRIVLAGVSVLATGVMVTQLTFAEDTDLVPTATDDAPGFAVLELFTSQGCSSCPPADDVLADLDAEAREQGLPVYALSYHVDYWDRLGWPDPFSDPAYTQRQRDYAAAFRSQRIYTPQLVVNGVTGFVGSRRNVADQVIAEARAIEPRGQVTLHPDPSDEPSLVRVRVKVIDAPPDAEIHVAFVQRSTSNDVARGENASRHLKHVNVVRDLQTLEPAGAEQSVKLSRPSDAEHADVEVIAFLQVDGTGEITAAQRLAVPTAP